MDKLLRTMQVHFPYLLDTKFAAKSLASRTLRRPQDHDFRALSLLPDFAGALYLDVGANRGQSTEAMLMLTRHSSIVAFEPNPLLCDRLGRRFRNDQRVAVHGFGLGNQDGTYNLYVPFYKSWMFDGLASFKRESASDWLRGRVYGYQERHLAVREIACQIRKLDDLGLAPYFVKLDVQGYELEALTGGRGTLAAHEPILLIESPDGETIQFLKRLDYRPYRFEQGRLLPDAFGVRNTYFMTGQRAAQVAVRP